jgi:hypothetical protein
VGTYEDSKHTVWDPVLQKINVRGINEQPGYNYCQYPDVHVKCLMIILNCTNVRAFGLAVS